MSSGQPRAHDAGTCPFARIRPEHQHNPKLNRSARGLMSILDGIVIRKREEARRLSMEGGRIEQSLEEAPPVRDFEGALRGRDVRVIAEFKRRSPSAGWIRQSAAVDQVTRSYAQGGAAALS